jgi:WD40 repeat protein
VADFGVVKLAEASASLTMGVIGTPEYMSPEQGEGKAQLDGRSDVYALGVIVYQLLAGKLPYQADTPMSVIYAHLHEPLPDIRAVKPDLPKGIKAVLEKALAKERNNRYPTARDFAAALAEAVELPASAPEKALPAAPQTEVIAAEVEEKPAAPETEAIKAPPKKSVSPAGRSRRAVAIAGLLALAALAVLVIRNGGFALPALLGGGGPDAEETAALASAPLPTPTPQVIMVENAGQLQELQRLGDGTVRVVSFSPNGETVAIGGSLGVWLFDAQTLEVLHLLVGHDASVVSLDWSPDGGTLASASSFDREIMLWDATTGEQVGLLEGHTSIADTLDWSPDGSMIASGGLDDTVLIWDAETGEEIALLQHNGTVNDVAFSSDSRLLASASADDTVKIWDAAGGSLIHTLAPDENDVHTVAWSPSLPVVAAFHFNSVILWNTDTGDQIEQVGSLSRGLELQDRSWSPDGETLVLGGTDGTVRLIDGLSGGQIASLEGHEDDVEAVVWSPDGSMLASGGADRTVRLWDAQTGVQTALLVGHEEGLDIVAWSPDSSTLISIAGIAGAARLWDADTGQQIAAHEGFTDLAGAIAWSPSAQTLAVGNQGDIALWDAVAGLRQAVLISPSESAEVEFLLWSPDGRSLSSITDEGELHLWDVRTTEITSAVDLATDEIGGLSSAAFSPDGSLLATGGDGLIKVSDTQSGEEIGLLEGHAASVTSLAWSSDGGPLASGDDDGAILLWDADGNFIMELAGHADETLGRVESLAWSPDGSVLASGSAGGLLSLWDTSSGEQIVQFEENIIGVESLALSSDGALLASGDGTGNVWLFDTAAAEPIVQLEGHTTAVLSLAWSPDGAILASSSADGSVRLWGIPQ